ncbi:aldehyde dehydrogenase [Actinoplanes sp. SE50]|uniref:aldehyde dehydrogenase family protein n=1 Tax=unclassified Actinoplanes TaxID=2626549 RepID=UPI00023EDCEE|nr:MULTISPECIES: aldehyde dehydrogenase family protein [unclassified Actinoplanes]AEV88551.1 betaine-aldehyde dehydrogenase [Actinoplanes sp. SE50/110]ATO86956.1 aldehyde dehydrogenase [Actinoplanes sp. SE50]SLM04374.1 aldehyde dehydrogenase [Actinoplanes sp. SE50/110]
MTSEFREQLYIGGAWVPPAAGDRIEVENPYTEQVIGHVPAGTAADVDLAVAAARRAFDGWAGLPMTERGAALDRLHRALAARAGEIARTVGLELGTPLKIAQAVQAGLPLTVLRGYADAASRPVEPETIGNSLILREAAGVVGAITPWNYPLHQVVAKVGAALAAGCTVVLKPSELTPLVAYLLFDAAHEAGLPAGVLNLVTGTGPVVGAAIAGHPDVDMISFTGSTATGRAISHAAADRIAKVSLELGGKSANVILEDADLVKAVKVGVGNALLNSGQTCTAWTRMLVHRAHYDEAVALAAKTAVGYVTGDPFDPATRLGPLVSAAQKDRVRGFIDRADARLVAGGPAAPVPGTGHFVAPTVFADVDPDSELAQEEIFGPVLSIIPFDSDDQAVAIANNSKYGLAGGVWGSDERALAVARRIRTGAVDVNGGSFNPLAPFGGYKQSGVGRELGRFGLEEFQQVKAVQR